MIRQPSQQDFAKAENAEITAVETSKGHVYVADLKDEDLVLVIKFVNERFDHLYECTVWDAVVTGYSSDEMKGGTTKFRFLKDQDVTRVIAEWLRAW